MMAFWTAVGFLSLLGGGADKGDFPQFRGPNGNGVVLTGDLPTTWKKGVNIAWTTPLPGTGWSQPVLVGETLFLTAAVGDKLAKPKDMQQGVRDLSSMGLGGSKPKTELKWQAMAVSAATGSILWTTTVAEGKPKHAIHPSNTYATETACADAERVYVYFGATGTAAALDHRGNLLWKTELGSYPTSAGFGTGASPLLIEGRLVIASFNEESAFVVGLDPKNGKEVWREKRAKPGSSWATPFPWRNSKRTEVVCCGDKLVTSHDPRTGKELWRLGGIGTAFAPSPSSDGDLVIFGASSPMSATQMFAVKAGGSGDLTLKGKETSSEWVAWYRKGGTIGMSSPAASGGFAYWPGSGILTCIETATGKQVYKERIPGGRQITASVLVVGDKLLVLNESGKAVWVKTGPKFEVVGGGDLEDTFWSSPAVGEGKLYLRGVNALYCIRK
jgi:outer membrane protein assembly factor BamB